ncbi:hypothetical protein NECAME_02616 [Necator americanus]|uniref:Transmembrane protein n=1 Tax=Necator americanus TaxID=51031 RepID=W2TEQ8_NECAM|nr:hypothetical protein NECAME_02616 [Necator americanus]ETN79497.1 hypothetical protein NECAME_02616 [Necator americanus]
MAHERVKEVDEQCCSRPCSVIGLGIFLPAVLTFTTYYFANDYDSSLSRMRYLFEREEDGSTQSLERKRDISRALLDHVDVAAKTSDCDNGSLKSDSGAYLRMPQNLYDRAPMVSIV